MRSSSIRRFGVKAAAAACAVALVPVAAAGTAAAQNNSGTINYEKATADQPIKSTPVNVAGLNAQIVSIWSPSMEAEVPNIVQPPAHLQGEAAANAPVLYLVNGAGGGEDSATWQAQSDVKTFMADKDVWTVTPVGGAFSYYTDWQKPDPNVQTKYASSTKPMKFETYLTQELPQTFEKGSAGTNRPRSLTAISMTATSVVSLAEKHPGFYTSIGGFSGCAETSTPIGHEAINIVTGMRGGANLDNMWGPFPGQGWTDNDPVVNADKFVAQRDQGILPKMKITTGNGLPGEHENLNNWRLQNSVPALANQAIVGGAIEAATNYCTGNLARRFNQLGIPAQFDFRANGTHSWGYWQDDLHKAWDMINTWSYDGK